MSVTNHIFIQIFDDEFKPLGNSGYELITKLPTLEKFKSTLHRHRRDTQGIQAEPKHRDDIELHPETVIMADGQNFLLADNLDGDRILIFASPATKVMLKVHKNIFIDGTFKSVSKQFSQLYTIHVDLGSTESETNVAPVVFALLPDKKKTTYIRLFRAILREVPEWAPETVSADYEISIIEAVKDVFPAAEFQGCFFHFSQCLWRKIQNIGLVDEYKSNEEVRNTIKMCASLAFLNLTQVEEGWLEIHAAAPNSEKINQFFDYFVDQWMENPLLPLASWNCKGRRHRTNNAVEGWNHRFNTLIGRSHPRIKHLVETLKLEAEKSAMKFTRMDLGLEGVKRRRKYIEVDCRIQRATNTLEVTGDIIRFLRNISYVIRMD